MAKKIKSATKKRLVKKSSKSKKKSSTSLRLKASVNNNDKFFAMLGYFGILTLGISIIVPWLLKKDNKYVMFHVRQSLMVTLCFVVSAAWSFVGIGYLLYLISTSFAAYGVMQAVKGVQMPVPVVGRYALDWKI